MDSPVLITADADAELANTVAIWENLAGKTLVKGQPDYLLASILAYQKYLLLQRCNAAFVSMLIDFATSINLEYLVALLGVTRNSFQPATCTLSFTLIEGHGALTISAGTRVSSTDGKAVFEVDFDTAVAVEVNTVLANATCQSDGIIGNGYQIGTVSTIMDVQPYISACANIDITANGVDSESDEELRARAKLASSIFSVAGPRDAYLYFVKTVSSLISDVAIITAQEDASVPPGEVDIYPLLDGGQLPSVSLIDLIQSTLSAETIRPLSDTVVVAAPTAVHYDLTVAAIKLKAYPGTSNDLVASITAILNQYRIDKYSKLGQDIVASKIEAICSIAGVYDLAVTIIPPDNYELVGRNLIMDPNEFAYLDDISVSITGDNDG